MKKLIYIFTLILLSFTFLACPFYPFDDDLDNYSLMTPERLTELMNQYFYTKFTMKNYSEVKTDNYKYLVVYLEAEDLPGKEVKAYHHFGWNLGDETDQMGTSYSTAERTTIVVVNENLMTDYYFVKYQEEVYSEIQNRLQPLLQDLTENQDYILAIKPNLAYFPILEEKDGFEKRHFKDVNDFFENANFGTYLLINKEWNSEEETKFHSLEDSLSNSESRTHYAKVFYSKKYPASNVLIQNLTANSFYSQNDIDNGSVSYQWLQLHLGNTESFYN